MGYQNLRTGRVISGCLVLLDHYSQWSLVTERSEGEASAGAHYQAKHATYHSFPPEPSPEGLTLPKLIFSGLAGSASWVL